jgi:hypothetical protein
VYYQRVEQLLAAGQTDDAATDAGDAIAQYQAAAAAGFDAVTVATELSALGGVLRNAHLDA